VFVDGLLSSLAQVSFHMGLKRLVCTTQSVERYLCEQLLAAADIVNISR